MKLNRYFLIAAMGLGLFACTDDLENNGGQNGNKGDGQLADVSIKLDFRGSQTRAAGDLPTGDYDDGGSAEESQVNTLRVIVTDENDIVEYNQLYQGTTGDNKLPDGINGTGPTQENPNAPYEGTDKIEFQIPTGLKRFYVYVNEEAATPAENTDPKTNNAIDLKTAVGQEFKVPTAKTQAAAYFATANKFHMSGLVEQNITTVAAGSANKVTVNVDRVVAKVSLQLAAGYNNDDSNNNKVTLTSLTAGIGNADLTFTPETTGDGQTNKVWGTYRFANDVNKVRQTPYYGEVPTADKDNYDNIIVRSKASATEAKDDLLTKVGTAYPTHTYYCLENTHATYTKGNTTFVQIEAVMIPNEAAKFTYEGATPALALTKSTQAKPTTAATFYLITKVKNPAEDVEGMYLNNYMWEDELVDLYDDTEFLAPAEKNGVEDKNPAKIEALRKKLKDQGYEFTAAYQNGKGYFYKAVNDMTDANDKFTGKAPVFRNDWYDLTINSIKLPGSPTSEFGGEDPLHPDTDVEMTVKIRQWNKVSHDVDLE